MIENQLRFKRESRRDSERLGETRRNLEGGMVGAVGMVDGWGGSGENSPRLTYSAIADNPEED